MEQIYRYVHQILFVALSFSLFNCSGEANVNVNSSEESGENDSAPPQSGGERQSKVWDFTSSSGYIYDNTYVVINNGQAELLQVDTQINTASEFSAGNLVGLSFTDGQLKLGNDGNCDGSQMDCQTNITIDSTNTPLWANIVGYWKLDNDVLDSSSAANNGTANNLSYITDGRIGSHAGSFAGTGGINVGSDASLANLTAFTISTWIRANTFINDDQTIIGGDSDDSSGFHLFIGDSGGQVEVQNKISIRINKDYTKSPAADWQPYADGQWHHVLATGDTNGLHLYIDGAHAGSSAGGNILPSTDAIMIGNEPARPHNFTGDIDEVIIWNSALDADQARQVYENQKLRYAGEFVSVPINAGTSISWTDLQFKAPLAFHKELTNDSVTDYSSTPANILLGQRAFYRFNEESLTGGADNDFQDSAGGIGAAEATGTVAVAQEGRFFRAIETNGIDNYVNLPNTSFASGSAFTIGIWVNTTDSFGPIFSLRNSSTNDHLTIAVGFAGGDVNDEAGILAAVVREGGPTGYSSLRGKHLNNGEWHYVTLSREASGAIHLYLDGKLQGSVTSTYSDGAISGNLLAVGAERKWIQNSYTTEARRYLNARFDQLGIWDRALSDSEIRTLYRRGANRLKFQVRSCDDAACVGESWQGPDGTSNTFFSEVHNNSMLDAGSGAPMGIVNSNSMQLSFADFGGAGLNLQSNPYFQVKAILEADNNLSCLDGATEIPCLPELTSLTVGPQNRYYGGGPSIRNSTSPTIGNLSKLSMIKSPNCTPKLQLSSDGSNFYYWSGSGWSVSSQGASHANTIEELNSNLAAFNSSLGAGGLYFRAFLTSDTNQACSIDSIEAQWTN